jgi:hypothetical protein
MPVMRYFLAWRRISAYLTKPVSSEHLLDVVGPLASPAA